MKPVRTDDPIWEYPARWIEASGSELPWALRYDTWKALGATFVLWLIAWGLIPGLSGLETLVGALGSAMITTVGIIHEVDGDRSLLGVLEIYTGEVGSRLTREETERPTRERAKVRVLA